MRAPALTLALLAAIGTFEAADRLHLVSGGVVEAESWRIEGDEIVIDSPGGTMTIPRSLLAQVERDAASPARPVPASPGTTPPPVAGAPKAESDIASAHRALSERDFDRASRAYHALLAEDPDHLPARVGYAIAETALGRDPAALAVVLDGLARHPDSPELREILGDLRDREERVEDALAAWREAFRLAPSDRVREKIVKAERELAAGRDYAFTAAAHFNLRYDGDLDPELTAAVIDHLEDAFAEITGEFKHAPSQPITVVLYPQREFQDVTQTGPEVGGIYDGKIRVPLGGLRSLDERGRRLLNHELTHAIVHSKTRGNCPRWLHEGLAQLQEPRTLTRADLLSIRRDLAKGNPGSWHERAFSYPAALSLTLWLESRRGKTALVWILERLGEGESLDAALESVYGEEYAALCARWRASLDTERP